MIPAITRQLRHTARGIRASADVIEAVAARHRVKRAPRGISAAYDFATSFRYGEIELTPFQIRAEFEALLSRVQGLKPLRVLEIGTARGGTLFLLTRVADPHAIIVSVDMKDGPFGGGYPWGWIPLLRAVRPRHAIRATCTRQLA